MADNLTVTAEAVRPAGEPGQCFYCGQPVGAQHRPECVCVVQKTKLRAIIEVEVEMDEPASWDGEAIEFIRNDSSWCASNADEKISDALHALIEAEGCLCPHVSFEFVERVGEPFVRER